jgi:hypothetical protein
MAGAQHDTYMAHSPFYAHLMGAWGGSMPILTAIDHAEAHGIDLNDLVDMGELQETDFEHDGAGIRTRVHTLAFVMALGY